MVNQEVLSKFSKEQLIDLIEIYSKNWLAHDGVWFQSIERKSGMDEAMYHDVEAFKRFTVVEARRLKEFLHLSDDCGLDGLEQAMRLRFYANLNEYEFIRSGNTLVFRMTKCRVQYARKKKGLEYHPCKAVGVEEYSGFARTIDSRIKCRCLSCYPDVTDETCNCSWEFTIDE